MKTKNLIIWIFGIGLILFLCVLMSDLFDDKRVLFMDGVVMIIAYSLLNYVYGFFYVPTDEFDSEVPASGIKLFTVWIYALLAFVCIVFGRVVNISFTWQLFLHFCLLFFAMVGLLVGHAASSRLTAIDRKSQVRHANTDGLAALSQQVLLAASLAGSIDPTLTSEIKKLAERMGYITPSDSAAATMQEGMLRSSVNRILTLVNSQASADELYREVENAKTILAQRLRTY